MNIETLINARDEYEAALERYEEAIGLFMPRANEIAELFKSLGISLVSSSGFNDSPYELCNMATFKTEDDSRGLFDNKVLLSEDDKYITCSCKDYEDDELGRYVIPFYDFVRDDWRAYFTGIVDELQKEKLAAKVEKEYEDYLKLKEKFEN